MKEEFKKWSYGKNIDIRSISKCILNIYNLICFNIICPYSLNVDVVVIYYGSIHETPYSIWLLLCAFSTLKNKKEVIL